MHLIIALLDVVQHWLLHPVVVVSHVFELALQISLALLDLLDHLVALGLEVLPDLELLLLGVDLEHVLAA